MCKGKAYVVKLELVQEGLVGTLTGEYLYLPQLPG